jgi:hypothetical protein
MLAYPYISFWTNLATRKFMDIVMTFANICRAIKSEAFLKALFRSWSEDGIAA